MTRILLITLITSLLTSCDQQQINERGTTQLISTLDANMVVKPGDMVTMTVTGANDSMQISLNDSIVSVASSNANSVTFMIPTEIDEGEFEASLMTGTDKIRLGTVTVVAEKRLPQMKIDPALICDDSYIHSGTHKHIYT